MEDFVERADSTSIKFVEDSMSFIAAKKLRLIDNCGESARLRAVKCREELGFLQVRESRERHDFEKVVVRM